MNERRYNDPRYNNFELGSSIPSLRSSVKHTRETNTNPAGPRSFIPVNRVREPITFSGATENRSCTKFDQPSRLHEYHSSYRGKRPFSFYSDPLSATRIKKRSCSNCFDPENPDSEPNFPISQFPIFGLPENCVDQILSYFGDPDLSALALVDKDCRQLARARQFRSVCINFSSASMDLLKKLVNEGCDRAAGQVYSKEPKWTLGACIRRISIAFESGTELSTYKPTSWVDSRRRNHEAIEYHQRHMNALELALKVSLPNLDFLEWRDRIPITPVLTHAITSSPITRLELHNIFLSNDFEIPGSKRDGQIFGEPRWDEPRWKLRRLVLSLSTYSAGTVVFTRSILKLAAPTLEELIWNGCWCGLGWESYSFGPEPIIFKKLKKLRMKNVMMADDTVLPGLIPNINQELQLVHLWLECAEEKLGSFFAERGHIPTLKYLNWIDFGLYQDIDQCISFFSANPQLESFRLEYCPPKLADERVIPLFSAFHNLTSLAYSCETADINPATLNLIGNITTLKHLWLSAGGQMFGTFDWLIDHRILRKKLKPLGQLEWFALTKDHYPNGNNHVRDYREPKSRKWEDGHHRLMVGHALNWARSHPKLEWVYFGQVPMSIKRTGDGTGDVVDAVPLTQAREDCEQLLSEMWSGDCQG